MCTRISYRAAQRIDCTSIKSKASAVIYDMPSTHVSAGRLRAAARHAARYLHAESIAAVVSRNAVPMDVGRIALNVGSTSQVSIGIGCLQNSPIYRAAVAVEWLSSTLRAFCRSVLLRERLKVESVQRFCGVACFAAISILLGQCFDFTSIKILQSSCRLLVTCTRSFGQSRHLSCCLALLLLVLLAAQ